MSAPGIISSHRPPTQEIVQAPTTQNSSQHHFNSSRTTAHALHDGISFLEQLHTNSTTVYPNVAYIPEFLNVAYISEFPNVAYIPKFPNVA